MKSKNDITKNLEKKYKGKKVLVWGLGLHGGGVGTAKFFAKLGAKVLVTDTKSEKELKSSVAKLTPPGRGKKITFRLGEHLEKYFTNSNFVIRNPGVKDDSDFLRVAQKAGVKVENDIGIFFENSPSFKIGITGTKGKSTVTAMIFDLIKSRIDKKGGLLVRFGDKATEPTIFNKVFFGGNIRKSVFDCLEEADEKSIVVLELSSAQLHHARYAKRSPDVAVITNIYPEHISFHFSYENYIEAKRDIYRFQKKNDILITNKKLQKIIKDAKSKKVFFDGTNDDALFKFAKIFGIENADIKKVIRDFKGLEGRKESVAKIKGRTFINDTTATHPSAVNFALEEFKKPILILGGVDKMFGGDVDELAEKIETRNLKTVLLPGSFSDKIKEKFSFDYKAENIFEVENMKEAVKKAYSLSKKGDTILLSPGGASFNLFINEFDRGKRFIKEVNKLK
ncbi:MAG: Mur ligase family protein [Patescibacteria group bacterium]|nr:Mur ligase family protein [Patescibacteria group bacterium]